jgi:uncharacterized protein (TIGR00251 family)
MDSYFNWQNDELHLRVKIQPGSSRNQIVGVFGDVLKVKITAPPIDGRANKLLQKFLGRQFKVPAGRVSIIKGLSSRDKQLCIVDPKAVPDWLQ